VGSWPSKKEACQGEIAAQHLGSTVAPPAIACQRSV
jgi:hypothetical protein